METAIVQFGLAATLIAIASLVADRFRISAVPLLILVGLAVGPHVPHYGLLDLRFTEIDEFIHLLGRLGVIFLLFSLGLEFSVRGLSAAGRTIVFAGVVYIAVHLALGLLFASLVGWPLREVLVVMGIMSVSSSAIVAKLVIDLRRSGRPETGFIVGIIMVQDVFLAVYLTLVSSLVLGEEAPIGSVAVSLAATGALLVGLLTVGRYAKRYLNRMLRGLPQESFLLTVFAILFLVAGFSAELGLAEAVAALLAGLVLAETEHVNQLQRTVVPFRNLFGAIFFFSFGLSVDPLGLQDAVDLAIIAASLTIIGTMLSGLFASGITGFNVGRGLTIGFTLISRGEFSIVLAGLAISGGLLPVLEPFAALYVLVLSVLGPVLTRESDRIAGWVTSASPERTTRGESFRRGAPEPPPALRRQENPNPGGRDESSEANPGDEDHDRD